MKIAILTLNPGIDRIIYLPTPARLGTLNRSSHTVVNQGSKGANVAIMLKTLGADPHYFTFTGGDMGPLSDSFTERAGIRACTTPTAAGVRMNVKVIDSEGGCTEFNERGGPVTEQELCALLDALKNDKPDVVVMNGSLPQGAPADVYKCIINHFREQGSVTVLDCDGMAMRHGLEARPTLVKPNRRELAGMVDCEEEQLDTLHKVFHACKKVHDTYGCAVICTLDEQGSVYYDGAESYHVTPAPVELKGFSGAGDTYLSAYIYKRFIQCTTIPEALSYASAAAGAKVALPGTTLPGTAEIERLVGKVSVREI